MRKRAIRVFKWSRLYLLLALSILPHAAHAQQGVLATGLPPTPLPDDRQKIKRWGRSGGEVPLKQLFGDNYPDVAKVIPMVNRWSNNLSRCASSCGVNGNPPCLTGYCTTGFLAFTSADFGDLSIATCGSLGAETLYVLASVGPNSPQLFIADACKNSQVKDINARKLLALAGAGGGGYLSNNTFKAIDNYLDPAASLSGDEDYQTKIVKVMHPDIVAEAITDLWVISLSVDVRVYGAGVISAKDGLLYRIDNCSGHFKPTDEHLAYVVQTLNWAGIEPQISPNRYELRPTTDCDNGYAYTLLEPYRH